MADRSQNDKVPAVSARGLAAALDRPWLAILIFSAAILKGISVWADLHRNFDPQDFSVYYCSGLMVRRGKNPYRTDLHRLAKSLGLQKGYVIHANDPPTFLASFVPLTFLPPHRAYWTWQAINAAALAAGLMLLFAPRYSGLTGPTALSLAAFAILYPPVGNNFVLAQSKLPILLLLAAMIQCMRRGHDGVAGLLLAAAGLLRLFPLLLGLYVVVKRRWRMLGGLIAGLVVGGLATFAAMGLGNSFGFLVSMRYLTSRTWISSPSNISLEAFVSRIFWDLFGAAPALEIFRQACVGGADLAVLYFVIRATPLDASEDRDWRALSLWIAASVMLSPTAWFHYLLLMLIPFAQMASAAKAGRISARALWMAIASYLLLGMNGAVMEAVSRNRNLISALREVQFVWLLMTFVAAYWFAADGFAEPGVANSPMRARGLDAERA